MANQTGGTELSKVRGVGPALAKVLAENGVGSAEALAALDQAGLRAIPGIGANRAKSLQAAAKAAVKTPDAPPQAAAEPVNGKPLSRVEAAEKAVQDARLRVEMKARLARAEAARVAAETKAAKAKAKAAKAKRKAANLAEEFAEAKVKAKLKAKKVKAKARKAIEKEKAKAKAILEGRQADGGEKPVTKKKKKAKS